MVVEIFGSKKTYEIYFSFSEPAKRTKSKFRRRIYLYTRIISFYHRFSYLKIENPSSIFGREERRTSADLQSLILGLEERITLRFSIFGSEDPHFGLKMGDLLRICKVLRSSCPEERQILPYLRSLEPEYGIIRQFPVSRLKERRTFSLFFSEDNRLRVSSVAPTTKTTYM